LFGPHSSSSISLETLTVVVLGLFAFPPFATPCLKSVYSFELSTTDEMGNIFGKDKPLKEVMRENKRMINRAVRELDREKQGLEREEKRLTMEIKKAAKEQQMKSVKIMAKVSKKG
jgi:hypothetical protein